MISLCGARISARETLGVSSRQEERNEGGADGAAKSAPGLPSGAERWRNYGEQARPI
jgi:hypothetical protein